MRLGLAKAPAWTPQAWQAGGKTPCLRATRDRSSTLRTHKTATYPPEDVLLFLGFSLPSLSVLVSNYTLQVSKRRSFGNSSQYVRLGTNIKKGVSTAMVLVFCLSFKKHLIFYSAFSAGMQSERTAPLQEVTIIIVTSVTEEHSQCCIWVADTHPSTSADGRPV